MFADGRSRKVVFLAHCLLNQNAISDGTAVYPAAFRELVQFFLEHQVGIVQLPCPELCCLGLDRGNRQGAQSPVTEENTRIRAAMQAPAPSRMLEDLVESVMPWPFPRRVGRSDSGGRLGNSSSGREGLR